MALAQEPTSKYSPHPCTPAPLSASFSPTVYYCVLLSASFFQSQRHVDPFIKQASLFSLVVTIMLESNGYDPVDDGRIEYTPASEEQADDIREANYLNIKTTPFS